VVALGVSPTRAISASTASTAAASALDTAGRGATVLFVEQEAENATTNGVVIGPNRTAGTLPGEASGRAGGRR
jgi:hypothetical protein